MKYKEFLRIAGLLNQKFGITPLLFGSLGLERRLRKSLNADDIDVLIPERILRDEWERLIRLMTEEGYVLVDLREHEFQKADFKIAFAVLEGLTPFAGIDLREIPVVTDNGVRFLLLGLPDYLKVYEASLKDGYRIHVKNKQDQRKTDLIREALAGTGRQS